MARKIQVEIIGDASKLERAFRQAGSSGSSFGRTMRKLAIGVGVAGVALGAGLASQVIVGVRALARMERISLQTDAALRSTGGGANVSREQLEKFADQLEKTTSVEAETIQEGQNLLLTFTKIRNGVRKSDKIFDQATKTIVDMSVALGQDMKSSAIQLGKALNDPIRGITALRRVGVSFTREQEDQIRALVESGKTMAAQKIILRELSVEFGRSGKNLGKSMEGRLAIIGHLVGEVQEAFAKGFLPVIERVAKVLKEKLADPEFVRRIELIGEKISGGLLVAMEALGRWFSNNWPAIKTGFRTTGEIITDVSRVVGKLVDAFKVAAPVIALIIQNSLIRPLKIVLALWSGILEGVSRIPVIGGKVEGALDAVNKARESTRTVEQGLQTIRKSGGSGSQQGKGLGGRHGGGRAKGGPVLPGTTYRVGERGPELLTMGRMGGSVSPNAGGVYIANVTLPGVTNARQFLAELQRIGKSTVAQQRGGSWAGQNLALG